LQILQIINKFKWIGTITCFFQSKSNYSLK
jgi:hypothetical protein